MGRRFRKRRPMFLAASWATLRVAGVYQSTGTATWAARAANRYKAVSNMCEHQPLISVYRAGSVIPVSPETPRADVAAFQSHCVDVHVADTEPRQPLASAAR